MCGRTACTLDPDDVCRACSYKDSQGKWTIPEWRDSPDGRQYYPSYNKPPTSQTPVIISTRHVDEKCEGSGRIVQPMYWSLVPSWHKGELQSVGFNTNNARLETIMERRMYSGPLKKGRRCVVLADGYYEWQKIANASKQAYFIYFPQPVQVKIENDSWKSMEDEIWDKTDGWKGPRLLTMAGVFDTWLDPSNSQEVFSYAIVTQQASSNIAFVHERMPAILDGDKEIENWLDFGRVPAEAALKGLKPFANLSWHPVSKVVGKSTNQGPECIQPIDLKVKQESKSSNLMMAWLKKGSPSKDATLHQQEKEETKLKREAPSPKADEKVKRERLD